MNVTCTLTPESTDVDNKVWQTLTSGKSKNDLSLTIWPHDPSTWFTGLSESSSSQLLAFIQATPRSRNPTLFCLNRLITQDSAAIGLFFSYLIEANFTYDKINNLKRTIRWHSACSQCCATTSLFLQLSSPPFTTPK